MKPDQASITLPAPEMRSLIEDRLTQLAISFAGLSKAIGKNSSYMHHFLKRGTPRYLDEADRAIVSNLLGIDEGLLAPPGSTRALALATPAPGGGLHLTPTPGSSIQVPRFSPPKREKERSDVPTFQQYDELDPKNAREWLPRLQPVAGTDEMIAVRMETGCGRVEPGDTVFLSRQAARIGDTVFTLKEGRLGAWGRMMGRTEAGVTIAASEGTETIPLARNEMLRLVAIVTV